jgi:hypothetical protein
MTIVRPKTVKAPSGAFTVVRFESGG